MFPETLRGSFKNSGYGNEYTSPLLYKPVTDGEDTEKVNLTVKSRTVSDLLDKYPDALSSQEAVRMAISDAIRDDE